jgi:hypothetical protein
MRYNELDTVVLNRDVPEHGLRRGDLGTIVHLYEPDGLEVEFVTGAGTTQAVVTLSTSDVRQLIGTDLLAVRPLNKSA